MKVTYAWHTTPWGRFARFLGGIKPAIPVLLASAAAMGYATILESNEGADVARRVVYGSWWFIGLMGWICLALIFAVITRYPWKRHHVGFMIVHASLVTIIIGGFVSLFTRVEGTMTLDEGDVSARLEVAGEQIEVLVHNAGQFAPDETIEITGVRAGDVINLDDLPMTVLETWPNSRVDSTVRDDGARPLHAIELSFDGNEADSVWIGETLEDDPRAVLHGVQFRVMPVGNAVEPLDADSVMPGIGDREIAFVRGPDVFDVPSVGAEVFDGWRVVDLQHFKHALVNADGLVEGDQSRDNPAILIVLGREDGSLERHICFERYPEMVSVRPLAGDLTSGAVLRSASAVTDVPRPRIVFHDLDGTGLHMTIREGAAEVVHHIESIPFTFDLAGHVATLQQRFTHARQANEIVAAPSGDENRPALVVNIDTGYESHRLVLPWKQPMPFMAESDSPPLFFTYGPPTIELPFALRLDDFCKTGYPGSDRAMAYESDVTLALADADADMDAGASSRIWMNHPLKHDGWKVYQAGFVGESISVFSIARDPGLWTTYFGSIGLCCGIAVMFYSRRFSRGHPGIPRVHPSVLGVAA